MLSSAFFGLERVIGQDRITIITMASRGGSAVGQRRTERPSPPRAYKIKEKRHFELRGTRKPFSRRTKMIINMALASSKIIFYKGSKRFVEGRQNYLNLTDNNNRSSKK